MQHQDTAGSALFLDLSGITEQPHQVFRYGYWFEKSGASMAIYNHKPREWNGVAPECPFTSLRVGETASPYLARFDLRDGSYQAFLEAIDAWALARYLEVA